MSERQRGGAQTKPRPLFNIDNGGECRAAGGSREKRTHGGGQYLYVWGGYVSVADHEAFLPNDELWLYDLENGLHQLLLLCSTGRGGTCVGPCGCIVNEELFIFGGCCDDGQTNEVKLHSVFTVWRRVTLRSGSLPSPRDKLSCWVHEGRLRTFSGDGTMKFRSLIRKEADGLNRRPS
uniref:Kelch domain containing 1 n=1 Tax=Sinocyclocheilus rhinocerous TaxID=307959 RepID=A0A673NB75_9TELE